MSDSPPTTHEMDRDTPADAAEFVTPPRNDSVLDQRLRDVLTALGQATYTARRPTYLPGDVAYDTHGPHTVEDVIAAAENIGFTQLHRGQARLVFRVPDAYTTRPLVVKTPLPQSTDVWTDGVVQNHNEARRADLCVDVESNDLETFLAPVFDFHSQYAWLVQLEGETYDQGFENPEPGIRAASRLQEALQTVGVPGEEIDTGRTNIAQFNGDDLVIDYGWWEAYDATRSYQQVQRDAHTAFTDAVGGGTPEQLATEQDFPSEVKLPSPLDDFTTLNHC